MLYKSNNFTLLYFTLLLCIVAFSGGFHVALLRVFINVLPMSANKTEYVFQVSPKKIGVHDDAKSKS